MSNTACTESEMTEALPALGFTEAGGVPVGSPVLHDEARRMCERNDCGKYGRTWVCPPAVGSLAVCRERLAAYEHMVLFSRKTVLETAGDAEEIRNAQHIFKAYVDLLYFRTQALGLNARILANGACLRCEKCTYPDAPCRHPEQLFHSLAGYGLVVSELAEAAHMSYTYESDIVTFYGAVLW